MKYKQTQGTDVSRRCQRLASKKHSCVLHSLRKRSGGKATTTNRFKGIQASPQFKGVKGVGGRTLIPDIKIGPKIIDAKFPCKKPVANLTKGGTHFSNPNKTKDDMLTAKEKTDYKKIKGVKSVTAMTPKEAKAKKSKGCTCKVAVTRTVK